MGIHDADPAFPRQSVLTRLTHRHIERIDIRTFRGGKPVVNEWTHRIIIRHYRTSLERVDVSKHKIPDVLGFLSAEVTPEQRTPFNVAL